MEVSIIGGAGRNGSHIAYACLLRNLKIDKLVLFDIKNSIHGQAMDLSQAACALGKKIEIIGTKNKKDIKNSDIVVIATGISLSRSKGLSKKEFVIKNVKLLDSITKDLPMDDNKIYIIISNPVDVLTYFLNKKIKNRKKVVGISTITDTIRMNTMSKGYLIGEHAGFMIPVDGKVDIEDIKKMRMSVVNSKGGTWFTTPVGVTNVIKSIINDEKKKFPVSTLLKGEYGFNDVCLSVPCIIGKNGIEKILEIKINKKDVLQKAAGSVKKKIKIVNKFK